jgi:hypothetical protein
VALMLNEKNIEALTAILAEGMAHSLASNPELDRVLGQALRTDIPQWATFLAARGVLVPSTLTDDELLACDVEQESKESPMDRAEVAASIRDRLERIARGEV